MSMRIGFTPWTPIRFSRIDNRNTINVWGRNYEFDKSFLPTSITTAGSELLTSPIELTAFFGNIKGGWSKQGSS